MFIPLQHLKSVVKPQGNPPGVHTGQALEFALDGQGSPVRQELGPPVDGAVVFVVLPVLGPGWPVRRGILKRGPDFLLYFGWR